jgi:hypothetical protein
MDLHAEPGTRNERLLFSALHGKRGHGFPERQGPDSRTARALTSAFGSIDQLGVWPLVGHPKCFR